jgi:glutamate dehydrogenase
VALVGGPDTDEAERFAARVPASYRERVTPELAAIDLHQVEALEREALDRRDDGAGETPGTGMGGLHRLLVQADPVGGDKTFRLRRYGRRSVELSTWLPILESFGLVVVEAVPLLVAGPVDAGSTGGGPTVHIDDFGLRLAAGHFAAGVDGARLVDALEAVSAGHADTDSLNRLVLAAGLTWPEVAVLRAYRRYRRQAGSTADDSALDDPLVDFPEIAHALIAYFSARFDPEHPDGRDDTVVAARRAVTRRLGVVTHLGADQVLRGYLALIDATLRTTYFLAGPVSGHRPTVAYKLKCAAIPHLPAPHPLTETWVHGPQIEGVHLRFGSIARGGIRWSDRPEDFRTEVLGLAEAQVKKNAVIVPTGAKGGFVCRGQGAPDATRVRAAYATFIAALLDITDNLVDATVVTPAGVVAYDGDDPYLVVAADKGTATFSDLANELARARGFWLDDAFASGGSHGYDHKAMGITARGAWVAVRRHFHQLGIDVASEPVTVTGVGDMSGDVFGNGMLQSSSIRLVAAFDHRHIFVDPDPDPGRSFVERRRMAALPRSSWDDYDRTVISPGGGVWARDLKEIPLSPAAGRALGLGAETISPPELISAILAAPVDLLWFGGIGTYLKAPNEADTEVGDRANDDVRITADQVRARVVAEGGNLAVTQRARIRYSRRGGRINTDFIDNAAGVATSDREVNLKILLRLAAEQGRLEPDERDKVLHAVEDQVASEVLRQVDHSVAALTRAVPISQRQLDAHESLVEALEAVGRVDRVVEDLPSPEEWARRREAGAGMIRPELAVVLAYAKSDLIGAIEASDLAAAPALRSAVGPYFAPLILERFGDLVPRHRLFPQLVATDLAGEIVDRMGIVWAHETADELGTALADVAGAFWAARQVLAASALWDEIETAGTAVSADADAAMHAMLAEAVGELARRYLLRRETALTGVIERDAPLLAPLLISTGQTPTWAGPTDAPDRRAIELIAEGVPDDLAVAVAARRRLAAVGDAAVVARDSGRELPDALLALEALYELTGAGRIAAALTTRHSPSRWEAWGARSVLDDLADWRLDAAKAALLGAGTEVSALDAVTAWAGAREEGLARSTRLLGYLDGTRDTFAVASLAVRNLRSVR